MGSEEYVKVTAFVPVSMVKAFRDDNVKVDQDLFLDLKNIILEEIPEIPELEVGLIYRYFNGNPNTYMIVRLGEEQVVLRRMNNNKAGEKGSLLIAQICKVEHDIMTGKAKIITEEEYDKGQTQTGQLADAARLIINEPFGRSIRPANYLSLEID